MYLDPRKAFSFNPNNPTSPHRMAHFYDGTPDTRERLHTWASSYEYSVSVTRVVGNRGDIAYPDSIHVDVITDGNTYYELTLLPGDVLYWDGGKFSSMSKRHFLEKYETQNARLI